MFGARSTRGLEGKLTQNFDEETSRRDATWKM